MKIRNLKTCLIGSAFLMLPMMCMHLNDGHHRGNHHPLQTRPPSFHASISGGMAEHGFILAENTDSEDR
jgi:hypothetical protein